MAKKDLRIRVGTEGTQKAAKDFQNVGKSVSNLAESFDGTAEEAEESRQRIAQLGDEMQSLQREADDAAASGKELDEAFHLKLDKVFADMAAEMKKFGDQGEQAADTLTDGFNAIKNGAADVERAILDAGDAAEVAGDDFAAIPEQFQNEFKVVQKSLDRFESDMRETGDVSKEHVEKVWRATELLRQKLDNAGVSVDDLGDDAVRAFGRFEKETKDAEKTILRLEDAVKKNEKSVRSSHESFTGLGDAIQQMGGKGGTAALKVGLIGAALTQGWQLGKKFAEMIGTDFSTMNDIIEESKRKTGELVFALSGAAVAAISGQWDEVTASIDRARAAIVLTKEELDPNASNINFNELRRMSEDDFMKRFTQGGLP